MKSRASLLEKNILLLKKTNTKLAYQMSLVDSSALEFCKTEKGELNLKRTYLDQSYYYHSQIDALQEAFEWFNDLDLQQSTLLYIHGIGLGYYYEAAKEWLKKDTKHTLVFLEEDRSVIYRLLETQRGSEILKNPQVRIIPFTDLLSDKELFSELAWTYIFCPFVVSHLKLYENVNPGGCADIAHQISHEAVQKSAFAEEYLHFGVAFFRNFYSNLLELSNAYSANELFDQFQGVPAIICGAGPSLNKNFDTLRTLTRKALIFAGSSALPALISKELIPHFAAAVDPNHAQLIRIQSLQDHLIPFFYRNRLFHDALMAIKGPRLYLTGTGGYRVSEWFEEQLKITGTNLDEGHNVINFCIEIAHALGCNPIILVGVDLAFTSEQRYAEGVMTTLRLNEEDFKKEYDFESRPLIKQDIYGKPVSTLWKWITEADWITQFATNHTDVTVINATEGGLGFEGISNQTLAEAAQTHLKNDEDFYQRIQAEIKKHILTQANSSQIRVLMLKFQESLKHCIDLLDRLIREIKNIAKQNKQLLTPLLESSNSIFIESEMQDEIGYQYLLEDFNVVYLKCNQRLIEALQFPRRKIGIKTITKKKIDLQQKRLEFLKDVARANEALIGWAIKLDHLRN